MSVGRFPDVCRRDYLAIAEIDLKTGKLFFERRCFDDVHRIHFEIDIGLLRVRIWRETCSDNDEGECQQRAQWPQ